MPVPGWGAVGDPLKGGRGNGRAAADPVERRRPLSESGESPGKLSAWLAGHSTASRVKWPRRQTSEQGEHFLPAAQRHGLRMGRVLATFHPDFQILTVLNNFDIFKIFV